MGLSENSPKSHDFLDGDQSGMILKKKTRTLGKEYKINYWNNHLRFLLWSPGPLVPWSLGALVSWSPGPWVLLKPKPTVLHNHP